MLRGFIVAALLTIDAVRLAGADENEIGVYAGHSAPAILHVNKGTELAERDQVVAARREFAEAIRLDPTMWPAYYNRARLEVKLHDWNAAMADINQPIRIKRAFWANYGVRANLLYKVGQYKASLKDYYKAVALAPGNPQRHLAALFDERAWLYATCPDASIRNGRLAVSDATNACKRTQFKNAAYIDTLAAAYAEIGDFEKAVHYEQQALAVDPLVPDSDGKSNKQEALNRLQLYKKKIPFRESYQHRSRLTASGHK